MQSDEIDSADLLRTLDSVLHQDIRMDFFALFNNGEMRKVSLADHHAGITHFELNKYVPKDVRTHFETAKNLYLYAWFVYRFHPIAEQQIIGSLEYAVRERLTGFGLIEPKKADKAGLSELLKLAKDHSLISNDAFICREKWATKIAKQRFSHDQIRSMSESGCNAMQFNDSQIIPTEEDLAFDWIGNFITCLPKIRNSYAHGSAMLHPTVLRTFEIVTELINQLFPAKV